MTAAVTLTFFVLTAVSAQHVRPAPTPQVVEDAGIGADAAPFAGTVLSAAVVTVRTNVDDVELQVDDEPVGKVSTVAVAPGKRRIWATKRGYYPASKSVTVAPGERLEIDLELIEQRPAEPPRRDTTETPVSWARRRAAPLIVAVAAVLALAALGITLARRRRARRSVPRSLPKLDAFAVPSGDPAEEDVRPTPDDVVPIVRDPDALAPVTGARRLAVVGAAATDVGRVKAMNQDSHLVDVARGLFVVADGIGGFAGGEVASATAVDVIGATLDGPPVDIGLLTHLPAPAAQLASALFLANRAIRRRRARDANLADMGTTCIAARFALDEERVYVAHVGDSRVYRLRGGSLEQITTDHTMGALGLEGKRAGHLSRALGTEGRPKIDILFARARAGDVYVLCCDGLTKMVGDAEITATLLDALARSAPPHAAAARLVDLANSQGGLDNITVAVAYVR